MLPIVGGLIEAGLKILDKVIPDPQAKAAAQLELIRLQQEGEFKELEVGLALSKAQTDINEVEAANANIFVSGWRPAIGWVCAFALAAQYIGLPALAWASTAFGIPPPPNLDLSDLLVLLTGMLGLGALRTTEKIKRAA